jgi:spore maturation protein A
MGMAMTWIVAGIFAVSIVCGQFTGQTEALAGAVTDGASAAVTLALTMAGILSLWSGVLEVLRRSGVMDSLAGGLRPVLRRLYPDCRQDTVMRDISANVSANLLGLGNAATPAGIRAAQGLYDGSGTASDSLCTLVVCNTASIQLIPTTVAAIRSAAGCQTPFDILPAVWLSSAISVAVGLTAVKFFSRLWTWWERRR